MSPTRMLKKSERRLLDCNHCCCDCANEKPTMARSRAVLSPTGMFKKSQRRLLDSNHCCCDHVNEKPVSNSQWKDTTPKARTQFRGSVDCQSYECVHARCVCVAVLSNSSGAAAFAVSAKAFLVALSGPLPRTVCPLSSLLRLANEPILLITGLPRLLFRG